MYVPLLISRNFCLKHQCSRKPCLHVRSEQRTHFARSRRMFVAEFFSHLRFDFRLGNGSDVFGSDICTCKPYLTYAIEECIRCAQKGKRFLSSLSCYLTLRHRWRRRCCLLPQRRPRSWRSYQVTSFPSFLLFSQPNGPRYLVYNLRKRGGDSADKYFKSTEMIAGVKDMRFQALMPDVLHWLGIQKVDNMVSMSDMYVSLLYCPSS